MIKLKLQQFAAPGSTSALREATFDNLQLNVGIFVKNFDYENLADANAVLDAIDDEIESGENLLGCTRGGGNFSVSREMRNPQIDGLRYRFKGGTYVDSADPSLSTTLVETTPDNFATALGGTVTTSGKKTTVKMPTALGDNAYLENLCWIGDLADGRVVMIVLYNAVNTADFTFTFADKGEGGFGVEFHGCQGDALEYDEAPFEVIFFETSGTLGELTVSSAAGTNVGETALTTTNVLASGEKYVYKVGNSSAAPTAVYGEQPDYTWTEWSGSGAINVGTSANGKKATLAVINASGRFTKSGTCTLAVKTA